MNNGKKIFEETLSKKSSRTKNTTSNFNFNLFRNKKLFNKSTSIRKTIFVASLIISIIALLTGITGTYFVNKIGNTSRDVGLNLTALIDATKEISFNAIKGHLLFDAIIIGDASEDIEEVWDLFDKSLWFADAVLYGGENENHTFVATDDTELITTMGSIKSVLANIIDSIHIRYDAHVDHNNAISRIDETFEITYQTLIDRLDQLMINNPANLTIITNIGEAKFYLAHTYKDHEELLLKTDIQRLEEDIKVGLLEARDSVQKIPGNTTDKTAITILIYEILEIEEERHSIYHATNQAEVEAIESLHLQFTHFTNLVEDTNSKLHQYMAESIEEVNANIRTAKFIMHGVSGAALLMALSVGTLLSRILSKLFLNLQSSNSKLYQAYDATIEGWAKALELRDHETEGHSRRVIALTLSLSRYMKLDEEEINNIYRGALLHDIGKMGVADDILMKQGNLSDDEWVEMKKHPTHAYEWLSPISHLESAIDIPFCHHEKWDGTGYPSGLKGEEIPLAARIFAIVDVWDALNSDRPYRKAWPRKKIIDYIKDQSGIHFDPIVVEAFLNLPELESSELFDFKIEQRNQSKIRIPQ